MQKTKKAISKRFKITGTGKVMFRSKGHRHLLSAKTKGQKQRMNKDQQVSPGFSAQIHRAIPFN